MVVQSILQSGIIPWGGKGKTIAELIFVTQKLF